jgi:hypothetical protein
MIFSNIPDILQLHQTLFPILNDRLTVWNDECCIGDIFNESAPKFQIYVAFYTNFSQSNNILENAMTNPECAMLLTVSKTFITFVFPISHVQRIRGFEEIGTYYSSR